MANDLYAIPSLEGVSHHEAAHAVAHIRLDLPGRVDFLRADDKKPRGGTTRYSIPESASFSKPDGRNKIVQCLVGAYAEAEVDKELPTAISGAADDSAIARSCIKIFGIDGTQDQWENRASSFVKDNWEAIAKVANALLAEQPTGTVYKLDGSKLYQLLGVTDL